MKSVPWLWFALTLVPGCLLVQPLDAAKSDAEVGGAAGSASAGRSSVAGSDGAGATHAGGSSGASAAGGGGGSAPNGVGGSVPVGGGPATVDPSAAFLGIWVLTDGSITLNCGGTPQVSPLTDGSADWHAGTTSDLVQTSEGTPCELLANISGRAAVGEPNQKCTESGLDSDGNPYSQALVIENYAFTINANGVNAKELFSGTDAYTDGISGMTTNCTFVQTGNYFKQ